MIQDHRAFDHEQVGRFSEECGRDGIAEDIEGPGYCGVRRDQDIRLAESDVPALSGAELQAVGSKVNGNAIPICRRMPDPE